MKFLSQWFLFILTNKESFFNFHIRVENLLSFHLSYLLSVHSHFNYLEKALNYTQRIIFKSKSKNKNKIDCEILK